MCSGQPLNVPESPPPTPAPSHHAPPTAAHLRSGGCRRSQTLHSSILPGGWRVPHPELSTEPRPGLLHGTPPADGPAPAAPHLGPREAAEPPEATEPGAAGPSLQKSPALRAGAPVLSGEGQLSGASTSAFLSAGCFLVQLCFGFVPGAGQKMEKARGGWLRHPGTRVSPPSLTSCRATGPHCLPIGPLWWVVREGPWGGSPGQPSGRTPGELPFHEDPAQGLGPPIGTRTSESLGALQSWKGVLNLTPKSSGCDLSPCAAPRWTQLRTGHTSGTRAPFPGGGYKGTKQACWFSFWKVPRTL